MRILQSILFLAFCSILFYGCQKDDIVLNKVPVANAGPSQTITLPTNNITLSGAGADSDGQIVAYLWSQISGASTTTIANPGAASTNVSGFIVGNYLFQLMVTDDDGATGVDTISIRVNPNPEVTLTLQPANNPNEKNLVQLGSSDISGAGGNEWLLYAWTNGGNQFNGRVIYKFDLSTIPSTATILSATLSLYSNTPPENGNFINANFGSNAFSIQQITSNWTTATTNWSNQPTVTTNNQVIVPSTTSSFLDLNVDVRQMVASMVSTNNYGFMFKLQNETPYNARAFVSSFHPTKADKRPKLVVVYRP